MPSHGNGGYIAQARELELAKRDNQRLAIEVSTRDAVIDGLRETLNQEESRSRELSSTIAHHVRTAFCLGLGVGVMVCVIVWGVVLLLR